MSYCEVADIRAEGVTPDDIDAAKLTNAISLACDYIDRVTGQWFEPREKVIKFDGRGGQYLVLPVFLFRAEYIRIDNVLVDDYVLYNRISPEDDRRYPRVYRELKWPKGIQNIQIKGKWGYVEEDGSTPQLIKRAAMKLALYNFPILGDSEAVSEKTMSGKLKLERTDGHEYELFENSSASSSGSILTTGDDEIDGILKYYTRPRFSMAIV